MSSFDDVRKLVLTDPRFASWTCIEVTDRLLEVRRGDEVVAVADARLVEGEITPLAPYFDRAAMGLALVVLVGEPPAEQLAALLNRGVFTTEPHPVDAVRLATDVKNALDHLELRARAESRGRWVRRYRYELGELIEIARALTRERDIESLLEQILSKSRFITGSDAASIYVVEGNSGEIRKRRLRFKLSQNESREFLGHEFTVPVSNKSVVGAAVLARSFINIPDVYQLPPDTPYQFDRTFDDKSGYRTRSVLAVPMISAEGDVIGVIQLINRKRDPERRLLTADDFEREVVTFDERCEELLGTLAAQAGIALENALLYGEIRGIFEGFVRASVQAIEQRDPTTSGHSLRVSVLCTGLAEVVDGAGGRFAEAHFTPVQLRELEYAALLHDFGKIGVREQVLVKAKKLYPHQLEAISSRLLHARRTVELETLRRKLDLHERGSNRERQSELDRDLATRTAELDEVWRLVVVANEPTVLREGDFARIAELVHRRYRDPEGRDVPFLLPEEAEALQITRGSLTSAELEEIRRHVVHSFNFLSRIPWGKNFLHIPEIAGAHHERLDGSGYPHGLRADQIPLPSKIMAIADVYDALTASDRPYKKAVPVERALDILRSEARVGQLDHDLLELFIEAGVYHRVEKPLSY